jgi:trehalose 6-phosphate phosphatase
MQNPLIADFMRRLRHTPASYLLLDYDGTLAPFHADRNLALPYPGAIPILERILQVESTRVVIISGRQLQEIQNLITPLTNLEIWGAHGLEHRSADGVYHQFTVDSTITAALDQAASIAESAGFSPMLEKKPGGIALHWRGQGRADATRMQQSILPQWTALAATSPIKLLHFDAGLELRLAHPDKGDAIRTILTRADPGTEIAFLGDDITDEDGFSALGSRGLSVLVRSVHRKTAAHAWLKPPDELLSFLHEWHKAISS